MFSTILCPVDFSDRSRGAAHVARAFGLRFHSEIVLLHVSPLADAALIADSERKLAELMQSDLEGCKVSACVVPGDAADRIVQFTEDRRTELVVIATHGTTAFRKFELGSVTTKVLHAASCPVWTSPHLEHWPAVESMPMRTILCALDFGPRSCMVLNWATRLASEFGAKLMFTHVVPGGDGSHYLEAPEKTLQREMERLTTPCEARVLSGTPGPLLSELAEEIAADLTLIGRTHAPSTRLGANAYAIVAHSPCPVLSV